MITVLFIIACGIAGWSVVNEEISYFIKKVFFLHKEIPAITAFASFKLIRKAFGLWSILLLPVIALAIVHRTAYKLLNCPYCSTFQIGLWASIAIGYDWPIAIIIAFNSMLACGLYNLIRTHHV